MTANEQFLLAATKLLRGELFDGPVCRENAEPLRALCESRGIECEIACPARETQLRAGIRADQDNGG